MLLCSEVEILLTARPVGYVVYAAGKFTGSCAVAERLRDALYLYLASAVQYLERRILLLVTSASDLPMRTIKFCSLRPSRRLLTSSSAVAKKPCDASCLSVVSFNSTKRRVDSFIVSYIGYE